MKRIKQLIFLIITMFALIFITVFLTGGRETYEFTKTDTIIFTIFWILEALTMILLSYVLTKYCKESIRKNPQLSKNLRAKHNKTKYEKIMTCRGYVIEILSYVTALGATLIGITVIPLLVDYQIQILKRALLLLVLTSLALIPLNFILHKCVIKKIENSQIKDIQQYIYSHRECANDVVNKKYRLLHLIRFISTIYYILIWFMAFGIAFLSGVTTESSITIILCLYSAIFIACALSKIRLPIPTAIFQDDKRYVNEAEYPNLYKLIKKAAKTMNCNTEIKLAIVDGFNAGIARYNKIYSVQLGAYLINALSQDELYTILLHEFSHMCPQNEKANSEKDYCNWLQNGISTHFLAGITGLLSLYTNTIYSLNYSLFEYASAIQSETDADKAMANYGDAKFAASALLKIKYFHLYQWEKGTYDEPSFYASETLEKGFLFRELKDFNQRLKIRIEDWKTYTQKEILGRNATHPTFNMRLNTLGISTYELLESTDSVNYKSECIKTLSYLEDLIYDDLDEHYTDAREQNYVKPLKMVEEWECDGKPLVAEEYVDIGFALRQVGRNSDALELYYRAISELSLPSEVCHARFIIGCFLLHQFDSSGLDNVYYAIDNNTNYIDEGLDVIGEFCCLTGNQVELERFREKAMELAQKQKDIYSQIGILSSKDQLSSEYLPDGMLDEILSHISKIDEQSVEAIYLVRKTITTDFFTSVFIIKFTDATTTEIKENVLHKIYLFLDTFSSWQFSLFEYSEIGNIKLDKIKDSCVFRIDL